MENRIISERANQYKKCFSVRDTPKRGREVIVKDEAYRNRDLAEKTFDNLKDKLNLRSTQKQHDLYIGFGVEPPVHYLESSL